MISCGLWSKNLLGLSNKKFLTISPSHGTSLFHVNGNIEPVTWVTGDVSFFIKRCIHLSQESVRKQIKRKQHDVL